MTLMPAFDPYAAARLPLTISQEDLAKAARNRPKEGDTKPARGKKGGTLTFPSQAPPSLRGLFHG